jgi:hypothetical protein
MKKLSILLSILIQCKITFSQGNMREIKFLVIAATLNDRESVFIVGNDEQLRNWNPYLIKLEKLNDFTWSKIFLFEEDKSLEYKFTKGGWENEALSNDGSIPDNSGLFVVLDTIMITEINAWRTIEQRKIFRQITGTIEYYLQFEGNELKPRDVIVWLPPSYFFDINKRYPVLYMHDGQNIIDPATSVFVTTTELMR